MKSIKQYPVDSKHGIACNTVKSDLTPSLRRKIRKARNGNKKGGLTVQEIAAIKVNARLGRGF